MQGKAGTEGAAAETHSPGQTAAGVSTQLSALLEELARAPEASLEEAWQKGLRVGDEVGRYRLMREVGRGGFGVVYEAVDRELGRAVALKAIKPGSRSAHRSEDWLRREAEAVARLNHPAIVTLHDMGRGPTGPFLIFELLRGSPLDQRLQEGKPLPVREALHTAQGIAEALAHAHAAGVVHRDLKPSNVFVARDGGVKVLDFGLAFLFGRGGATSGGTPAYMAPEQWRSEPGDERVDLFALGCMLHQMLTGRLPYRVTSRGSEALEAPAAPPLARQGVPAALRRLVARCLEPDPARRPPSAAVVLGELRAMARAIDGRQRRRGLWAAAAALILAGAGARWALDFFGTSSGPRITVAVADVVNRSGEPALDGLSGLLITSLEQSRRLQVLSRARMLDLARQAGRADPARIDEEVGREIAASAGARALLLATLHRFDQRYALELRAVAPGASSYLFTLQEQARSRDELPDAIDRISAGARRALSERPGDLRAASLRVREKVTGSLDAYGRYQAGMDCMDHPSRLAGFNSTDSVCNPEFEKAVQLDPGFSMAWYQLALNLSTSGAPAAEVDRAMGAALAHLDRAPPRERLLIQARRAELLGETDQAHATYRQVLERTPEDKRTLGLLAELEARRGRLAEAVPWLEKVLFLDPTSEDASESLVQALGILGRREDLAARLRQWEVLPRVPSVTHAIVRARVWLGDGDGAVAAARQAVAAGGGPLAADDLVGALQAQGDFAEVEAQLRRRQQMGPLTAYMELQLLGAVSAQGRVAEARARLGELVQKSRDAGWAADALGSAVAWGAGLAPGPETRAAAEEAVRLRPDYAWTSVYLALMGDLQAATRIGRSIAPESTLRAKLDAVVAWKQGDLERARTLLASAEARDPYGQDRGGIPAFLQAEVAAAAGDAPATLDAVRRYLSFWPRGIWRSWAYPRSLFLRAQALSRLGRRDEARLALDRLLALWENADPGLPILAESRQLRASLH